MARRINPTFIPTATANSGSALIPLTEIPAEIVQEVEEIYAALKTADGRMRVEFDSKAELAQYIKQVDSYCRQRPTGVIRFRKSPTKGLKATEMDYRITDVPVTDDSKAATEAPEVEAAPEVPPTKAAKGSK